MKQWPADEVARWPIANLTPYARNARMHSEGHVAQIVASMERWGVTMPILVDEGGEIIAGHGRVMAAEKLGYDELPVLVARGWSDEEKKAYRIADNRLSELSTWDTALLAAELSDLGAADFDLSLVGYSTDDLANMLGTGAKADGAGSLADRFLIPPFSVLNAREGWWQDRKRAWLALGIQSELGRGEGATWGDSAPMRDDTLNFYRKGNATPGGSPLPAADYSKRQRGDGAGRPIDG